MITHGGQLVEWALTQILHEDTLSQIISVVFDVYREDLIKNAMQ